MSDLISQAQKQIAAILAKLEKEGDIVVKSIELDDIDVTKVGDDRRVMRRSVSIDCERLPGCDWDI